jgi:hypothetical protein
MSSADSRPYKWLATLWSRSDFDGEGNWTWDADLHRSTDGSYRVTVTQCPGAPGDEDWVAAEQDELSDGTELFEFLRPALAEWAGKKLTEAEWREVAKLIRQVDGEFAYDFEAAVDEHFQPQEFVGPPEPPTALERCVLAASWESPSFGGGAGWAAAASRSRMRSAVMVYAARYLASNGALPHGPHRVLLSYGPQGGADFLCPVGRSNKGTVDQVVLFPAAEDGG